MGGQFGRYRIDDGGRDDGPLGRLYRGYDPYLNGTVGIRMLPAAPDPDLARRLECESPAIVALRHENIARVFDLGQQDGVPYAVMELLSGETLDRALKSGTLAGKVDILWQVAKGLQYAHSVGVIHGDIRAGNILALPGGTVKILDFGAARTLGASGAGSKPADLFAYGVLCYELIAGTPPFAAGVTAVEPDSGTRAVPPPVRSLCPECPEALDGLIRRLLEKDGDASLDAAIGGLQAILQRLRVEQAAAMAESIPALVEAGEMESARETIAAVLDLDPVNAEGCIWREYLSALEGAGATAEPGAVADGEERARLALERFSKRRRQPAGEAVPGTAAGDSRANDVLTRLDPAVAMAAGTRLDPGPPLAAPSAEERARTALARHSAKTVLDYAGPAPPTRPIWLPPRRAALWACGAGVGCLILICTAWSLRPVRIEAVPSHVELHQECGHPADAREVNWAIPGLEFEVKTEPGWLVASRTKDGIRVSVSRTDLSPGPHRGTVRLDFRSFRIVNPRISIPVGLAVTIGANPGHLAFAYRRGGAFPSPQSVTVAGAASVVATTDAPWLRANAHRAGDRLAVRIWVEPYALAAGDYRGEVQLRDPNGYEGRVAVSLAVTALAGSQ
jgi:hypothetical protein